MADAILWRLDSLSFDVRQLNRARRRCEEGSQRFPNDDRCAICQLRLMTAAAVESDVGRAWELVARVDWHHHRRRRRVAAPERRVFAGAVTGRAA